MIFLAKIKNNDITFLTEYKSKLKIQNILNLQTYLDRMLSRFKGVITTHAELRMRMHGFEDFKSFLVIIRGLVIRH